MTACHYEKNDLYLDRISLKKIAETFKTPCYVYSKQVILDNLHAYQSALGDYPHQIAYAVKANSNLSLLKMFFEAGLSFDIVSAGELSRLDYLNIPGDRIFYSGVGKTNSDILAAIKKEKLCFNIESQSELLAINHIAIQVNQVSSVSIRINPNIDPKTHPYISTGLDKNKFGVTISEARQLLSMIKQMKYIKLEGISFHIGSQLIDISPILEAFDSALAFIVELIRSGETIEHIDIGGGLGIAYHKEQSAPQPCDYLPEIIKRLKFSGLNLKLIIEPGRSLVAESGILLAQIIYIKENASRRFVIVDAGMNDLLRPTLYQAYHEVLPLEKKDEAEQVSDIVGPVCESADFLALDRKLAVAEKDYLAILDVGAYGFSMSSHYNSRCKPAEVLIHGSTAQLIRRREKFENLYHLEII